MFVERVLGLPQGIDSWGVLLRMVHSKRNSQGSYQVTQSSCPPYCDFFQHLGCSPEDTFTFLSDWSNGNIATKNCGHQLPPHTKISACIHAFYFKHIWLHNSNNDNNSNCNNSTFKYANLVWVCSLYLTEMITEMFVYYSLLILPVLLYFAGNAFEANS